MKRLLLPSLSALVIAGLFAATAQAGSVTAACVGKGARGKDSSGELSCAGGLKGRTIAGVLKNDAGQPIAGKVLVTFATWTPRGGGFIVKDGATKTLTAKANGAFSITVNPATRQTLHFDPQADPALGISGGTRVDVEVARQFKVRLTKLGGGKVRFTVTGLTVRPVKFWVVDSEGYPISGVPKNKPLSSKGQVTYNLGSRRGTFSYFVDALKLDDLFWFHSRVKFHL